MKFIRIAIIISSTAMLGVAGCGEPRRTAKPKQKRVVVKNLKSPGKSGSAGKTDDKKTDDKKPDAKKPKPDLRPFVPPKQVRLDNVAPKQLDDFVAKQTAKKHVVLIDYWATWCAPCKKAFPHTVELSKKHAKDGLVVMSMSIDEFEDRADALAFLKKHDAKIYNFFPSDKLDPDNVPDLFGTGGGIPMFRIYGPDGKLQAEIKGGGDLKAKVDAALKEALGL